MNFGQAIEEMKEGKRVRRAGWNGKNMCIFITPGSMVPYSKLREETQKAYIDYNKSVVTIGPHIDMKSADGTLVIGWLASQTDMLSEDWEIAE